MKKFITICFLFAAFVIAGIAQTNSKKAVYTHNFPPEMKGEVLDAYIKLFEKGKILYDINCAKCHNIKVKGTEMMPEFTKEHLAQYNLRIQNPQHEEPLSEMRVNAEELAQITIFLTYYKKVEQPKSRKTT